MSSHVLNMVAKDLFLVPWEKGGGRLWQGGLLQLPIIKLLLTDQARFSPSDYSLSYPFLRMM
jgi:hypothetical protein